MKFQFKLFLALFLFCIFTSSKAEESTASLRAHVDRYVIEKSLKKPASKKYRHQVASQMVRMLDLAKTPTKMTLANMADKEYGNFNNTRCEENSSGIKVCVHNDEKYPYNPIRLTRLETHSIKEESDYGATVTWGLNPEYGCFPESTFLAIFKDPPIRVQSPMLDPFVAKEYVPIKVVEFRSFNPQVSSVFVRMQSSNACVFSITLSSIPSTN
ncbi:hypothetical protein NHH88_05915 [Oxalobacteraceae bacterium OTU3CAMAD1]|nr:hypothetical protein NHH88_05915 [Oxalobacteraceae bacterium OTU3CAMAD1]